jgi:hypothetical protein
MTNTEQHENIIRICNHDAINKHLTEIDALAEEAFKLLPPAFHYTPLYADIAAYLRSIIAEVKDTKRILN